MSTPRALLAAFGLAALAASPSPAPPEAKSYELTYDVRVLPSDRAARVSIQVGAGAELLRSVRLRRESGRALDFSGDGVVRLEEDAVLWEPPAQGGSLRYTFRIDHLRDAASYDARCADQWAVFRGDDLVPPARVVSRPGARAKTRLRLRVPEGWTIAAPYELLDDGSFAIDQPDRRFDRPVGWIAVGRLGVLRERIAGSRVAIAGPVGHGLRRHDLLALLRWTLPALRDAVGELPERILVVSAGDPMWRGGLSGPGSLFVHADRPLISSDLTSPLLHELVHTVMRARAGPGGDWVVEGLAELYSLELLVRSKSVSRRRHAKALRKFAELGRSAEFLDADEASGPVTARAVTALHALDKAIAEASQGEADLDDVLVLLARGREPITSASLRSAAQQVAGDGLDAFFRSQVPLRSAAAAEPSQSSAAAH